MFSMVFPLTYEGRYETLILDRPWYGIGIGGSLKWVRMSFTARSL